MVLFSKKYHETGEFDDIFIDRDEFIDNPEGK